MTTTARGRLRAVSGEVLLLAVLAAVLLGVTALVQPYQPKREEGPAHPRLSVHSNRPDGARALALWVGDLGYAVTAVEYRPFDVGRDVDVLLVLAPVGDFPDEHAAKIERWVEGGGTLVVAADHKHPLLDRLGLDVARSSATRAVPSQPLFPAAAPSELALKRGAILRPREPRWVPLAHAIGVDAADGSSSKGIVAAVAAVGKGHVLALSDPYPLSNEGLGQADNWQLPLMALRNAPAGATIAFDEYHHGLTEHGALGARLAREPWGWAILYAAGLLLAYTALRGRRFGRAIPVPSEVARRSRGEYVTTLAGLLRRGGHRAWLREQYAAQVKRSLGARYRVPADLPMAAFVSALAEQRPAAVGLAEPLERLERSRGADDAAIVRLMREIDRVHTRLVES